MPLTLIWLLPLLSGW